MESADSSIVTESTRSQIPPARMASMLAKPGLMPLPKIDTPPRSHAAISRSRPSPSEWPVMNAAVLTTLMPASRIRTISSTSGHFGL